MAAISAALGAAGRRAIGNRTLGLALLAVAILVVAGYIGVPRLLAPPVSPAINGTPSIVRRGDVAATVSATGSVIASRQSKLTMQSAGRLKDVPVRLGDSVKAGDVLARIDTAPLELKLLEAQSTLRTAQLKLEQLRAGARPEDVAQAEAAMRSAQAKLGDVQAGSPVQDIVQAQAQAESSAAAVRSAQARLDQIQAGAAPGEVAAAEQSVASAKATLEKAQIALAQLNAGPKPDDVRQQELAIEQGRNALWSKQLSRDATCGRGRGGACDAANADVAAAESAVTQASEKLKALRRPPDSKDVAARQADIDAAQETFRSAQVKLEQVKVGASADDVRQARASLEGAQATYQAALARVAALKQGAKAGELEAARQSVIQAEQQLALKKQPSTVQELLLAEEPVKQAEVGVRQVQLDLDNATLKAPYDGIVGTLAANVGEQVASGTTILTLVDPSQPRVDVTVDESDISKLAPGKSAQISFDALPERRLTGRVLGIAPSATVNQGVATYTVSVAIDRGDAPIPIGLTANVAIVTQQKAGVLLVPNRAIRRQGRAQVVEVLADGKSQTRTITTGLANDQITEIVDGLSEGETVIIPTTTTAQPRIGGFGGPPPGGSR